MKADLQKHSFFKPLKRMGKRSLEVFFTSWMGMEFLSYIFQESKLSHQQNISLAGMLGFIMFVSMIYGKYDEEREEAEEQNRLNLN